MKGQSATALPGMVFTGRAVQAQFLAHTIRLIGPDNGFGLSRDRAILAEALRAAGWDVTVLDTYGQALDSVPLQVHLEVPAIHLLGGGTHNVIIPHPEWWKPEWTEHLTRPDVRVWTKTADAARIFQDLGAKVDRLGWRSLDRCDPAVPRQRAFLHVAGQSPHKGTEALVTAWRPEWPRLTVVTIRPIAARSNVTVLGYISDEEIRRLQNAHAFHIYPSRYEGYGHAQWEGLSCGAVVFVPDGPPFDEHEGFRFMPARSAPAVGLIGLEVPTVSLVEAVEWAVSLSDADLAAHGAQSRRTWERATGAFAECLGRLVASLDGPTPQRTASASRRLVTLHSPHERCGVAEYGRQLDAAFLRTGVSPLALTFAESPDTILDAVRPGTTLLIHYEPALLPAHGWDLIRTARERGARIVFCCHYFEPGLLSQDLVDRFVVHRDYGIYDPRLIEIPLGCAEYDTIESRGELRHRLGLPEDRTVITTIGFLSEWKRIPALIDALLGCLPASVFLQVLTPLPFGDPGEDEVHGVRAVLSKHGAGAERVLFSTEFRPDRELLDRVHASDLGLLYHGQHTGSVSAATKAFVSARTPLVTTSSSHASDLRDGVVRVESLDLDAFAAEVVRLAQDEAQQAKLWAGMAREYDRLRMGAVAQQYLHLIRGLA